MYNQFYMHNVQNFYLGIVPIVNWQGQKNHKLNNGSFQLIITQLLIYLLLPIQVVHSKWQEKYGIMF